MTTTGTIVEFSGGTIAVGPNLVLSGSGIFRVTGGTLTLDAVVPNLQLNGGTLYLSAIFQGRSEEHTSQLQSLTDLGYRLLLAHNNKSRVNLHVRPGGT